MTASWGRPLRLFIVYSRKDAEFLPELLDHLSPLEHQGIVDIWYDSNMEPGSGWRKEIEEHLTSAEIVMVLVSASCLASKYCRAEISLALDLRNASGLRVIPVKLREVDWEGEPLSELQVLPKHGGALSTSADRHADLAEIARAVRKLASSEILLHPQREIGRKEDDAHGTALNKGWRGSPQDLHAANERALAMADLGELSAALSILEAAIRAARTTKSCDLAALLRKPSLTTAKPMLFLTQPLPLT
jgi:hypothetical protein